MGPWQHAKGQGFSGCLRCLPARVFTGAKELCPADWLRSKTSKARHALCTRPRSVQEKRPRRKDLTGFVPCHVTITTAVLYVQYITSLQYVAIFKKDQESDDQDRID